MSASRPRAGWTFPVALVSVGAMLGAFAGALACLGNGYLESGFRRNLFAELWPPVHRGALLGLLVAAAWIAARPWAARALERRGWLEGGAVARLSGRRGLCVAFFLAAAAVLSAAAYTGRVAADWPMVHGYLGFAALAALLLHRLARRRRGRAGLDPLLAALWMSAALTLGMVLALYSHDVIQAGLLPRSPPDLSAEQLRAVALPAVAAVVLSGLVLYLALLGGGSAAPSRRGRRLAAALAAGMPAAAWLALWAASPLLSNPTLRASHPVNVVFVLIDTLRYDRTALAAESGTGARSTPHLSRLAERSVSFERAITQAPWTLPACASMLTGLYPWEHGALDIVRGVERSLFTLPEILREAGYDTVGVVSNHIVGARYGFAQGFRTYRQQARGPQSVTGSNVTDLALEYLRGRDASPFFLYVHYFDPHYAYVDHEDWPYADAYSGWIREGPRSMNLLRAQQYSFDDEDLAFLRSLYDEEVAYADRELGRLLGGIEALGLNEETMIVVVSDHGEELYEHGWLGHRVMNEEVLRVPLLIALPDADSRSQRIAWNVESRAVFGTILEYLGLSADVVPETPSLLPWVLEAPSPASDPERPVLSQFLEWEDGARTEQWVVQLGSWKYLLDEVRDRESLFDLSRDPRERRNLADDMPEKVRELRGHLERLVGEHAPGGRAAPISDAEAEMLRALGYAS